MHLSLSASLERALFHAFQRAGDDECCGLVVGPSRAVGDALVQLRNVAADRTRAFAFDDVEHAMARRAVRQSGRHVVAMYHSHPRSPPFPSFLDAHALHAAGHALFPDDAVLIVGRVHATSSLSVTAHRFDVECRQLLPCAFSWSPEVGHVGSSRTT